MGQTTGFNREVLKKHVIILAEVENEPEVKYIHGNIGREFNSSSSPTMFFQFG